jgi:twitching motility protein PilT
MGFDLDLDDLANSGKTPPVVLHPSDEEEDPNHAEATPLIDPPGVTRPKSPSAPSQGLPGNTSLTSPMAAPSGTSRGVQISSAKASQSIDLNGLLTLLVQQGGSDLHLSVGSVPMIRKSGKMMPVEESPIIEADNLLEAFSKMATPEQLDRFYREKELDLAYVIPGVSRFRVNFMWQKQNPGGVFRVIPSEIKPLESLGMPDSLYSLSALPRGLVLVTGPTGSGKSTTLAALIDRANRTRNGHIVTIEDPIEFTHTHQSCIVNQRELGQDTHSFSQALKHVLRQDPDIILIGELRDLETISTALTAAETGHLVFATLHTQSAQYTVNRIIDVFPSGQQAQIRSQLASTLKAVVCQSLAPSAEGGGRVPVAEIMFVDSAIATMIRRENTHQIPSAIQASRGMGMQTMNQHLAELVNLGKIDRAAADELTNDHKDLDALITGRAGQLRKVQTAQAQRIENPINPIGLDGSSF